MAAPLAPGLDDTAVVIRSARERTEPACYTSVLAQGVPEARIFLIHESPFSKALRCSYEIGLQAERDWTLCLDADVVLRPHSIPRLLEHARRQQPGTLGVQGLMLDKLTNSIRAGGIHLYRTKFLTKAIQEIPEEGSAIRPETSVLIAMQRQDHPWITVPYVTGIHDFGQYYLDIYRKCYVHANKHLLNLPRLLPLWRHLADSDPDFSVAIDGLALGIRERGPIVIDKRLPKLRDEFDRLGIEEKSALACGELATAAVEDELRRYAARDVPVRGFPVRAVHAIAFDGRTRLGMGKRLHRGLQKMSHDVGLLRVLPYALGTALEKLGVGLKRLAAPGSAGHAKRTVPR